MKNRTLPRKLRRQSRAAERITDGWTLNASNIIYFDTNQTTITFPSGSFSWFAPGDIIIVHGRANEKIKKKKKVHVARRRKQEKQETYTITNVNKTTMTIDSNNPTVTKISGGIRLSYRHMS